MENGWSRFHSSCVNGNIHREFDTDTTPGRWLSQANYVFSQLPTPRNHRDYSLVDWIDYGLSFSVPLTKLPEGYLFLCPLEDLQDDTGRWLPNPEGSAYWSLDPSGRERLSPDAAGRLGFPFVELEMDVDTRAWDESVYAALGRFHAGKGFDPNSRDVARHLGQPLYELSTPNVDGARSECQRHVSCLGLT
ncbi:hypothetical protein C8R44DRAFT_701210 [Mycena epipterygia]|nr:hypothetical protein C8R44DRAFT_701210 [Mycena epipterygia]